MKEWIEAMRLRTIPVSVAGVLAGTGCAAFRHGFSLLPMIICLVFAILSQIVANFANEYYDFKNGLDRKGRAGFRRGVTEGDIRPEAMKRVMFVLLFLDAIIGCALIFWGGPWLILVGVAVALFALGYSAGPYPLSHHGLGDIAVLIFFGFVPVVFTEYVQTGIFYLDCLNISASLGVGLLAVNVLIVNNYRDCNDDRAVGKHTTVVIFGRPFMARVYLFNGVAALIAFATASIQAPAWTSVAWCIFIIPLTSLYRFITLNDGAPLNRALKFSSILLLAASIFLLIVLSIYSSY